MIVEIQAPKLVSYQLDMLYCEERNSIVEATTKAGKTFGFAWWIFERAHGNLAPGWNYWWVAPIRGQAKIVFDRIRRALPKDGSYSINHTELTITTPTKGIMWFKSADNPDSLYGEDVHGAVLDEASRMNEQSFFAVRSTLTATKGPLKIIGNVKGTINWFYKLARRVEAREIPDWKYFKITAKNAIDEGILDPAEIQAAKDLLPEGVFNELYYGIPFENAANKFAYSFSTAKHVGDCKYNPQYPLFLSFDFNRNPISCNVIQYYDNTIFVIEVIKRVNSNIYDLLDEIKTRYDGAEYIINGDATGANSHAMVKDNLSFFRIIKDILNLTVGQMQQLKANPKITENQVLVNTVLEKVKVVIDRAGGAPLIFDLQFAEMLPDGTLKKTDRNDPKQQLDALDGFRYFINRNLAKDFVRRK